MPPVVASGPPAALPRLAQRRYDGPMHILVIEDDQEAARYMIKGLRESSYTKIIF